MLLMAVLVVLAGCSNSSKSTTSDLRPAVATAQGSCAVKSEFDCYLVNVPVDYNNPQGEELQLQVAKLTARVPVPKGTILLVDGGPGAAGVGRLTATNKAGVLVANEGFPSFISPDTLKYFDVVAFDTRGSGNTWIDCPKLQTEVGSSDTAIATAGAVEQCANLMGDKRNFYSTAETVHDLERISRALNIEKFIPWGVSYGSYVSEQFSLAYPAKVQALILDSIVPQTGYEPLSPDTFSAVPKVVSHVCSTMKDCNWKPNSDISNLTADPKLAPKVFDGLVDTSTTDLDTFQKYLRILHLAATGKPALLAKTFEEKAAENLELADNHGFSAGLHQITWCSDMTFPWGRSDAPLAGRQEAVAGAVSAIPRNETWPFPQDLPGIQGAVSNCVPWPSTQPATYSWDTNSQLPDVPTLIVNGGIDLSTPASLAIQQAQYAPQAKLVILKNQGHGPTWREKPLPQVEEFLTQLAKTPSR